MRLLLLAACAAFLALPTQAQRSVYTFSGSTVDEAIYDRPDALDALLGEEVAYDVVSFTTDTSGDYVVTTRATYDAYLNIYAGAFDPNDPLATVIAGVDDCRDDDTAFQRFPCAQDTFDEYGEEPLTLQAGVTYFVVQSGYDDEEEGVYTGDITGPAGAVLTGGRLTEGMPVDLGVFPAEVSVPSSGGKARFDVIVTNFTDERIEGGIVVLVNGTFRRILTSALVPGGSQAFRLNLSFPARVPDGVYEVTLLAVSDEGTLEMEGPFDVVVGDAPTRLAHPSAVAAALKARVKAGDKSARAELDAYRAAREATALLVGVEGASGRRVLDASSAETK